MRETMGRRIDGLNSEERDRIITATEMNDGRDWVERDPYSGHVLYPICGCLEGVIAEGLPSGEIMRLTAEAVLYYASDHMSMMKVPWRVAPASLRYPLAVVRFGKERVVRALKLRAAAPHSIHIETEQEVTC